MDREARCAAVYGIAKGTQLNSNNICYIQNSSCVPPSSPLVTTVCFLYLLSLWVCLCFVCELGEATLFFIGLLCGLCDLGSPTKDRSWALAALVPSPKHWAARAPRSSSFRHLKSCSQTGSRPGFGDQEVWSQAQQLFSFQENLFGSWLRGPGRWWSPFRFSGDGKGGACLGGRAFGLGHPR